MSDDSGKNETTRRAFMVAGAAAAVGAAAAGRIRPDKITDEQARLIDKVTAGVKLLHDADPDNTGPVPVDLITASASGLDPEISPAAAEYQASRVARLRNLPLATVQALITQHPQRALFDILGEARVNVLELNLALDSLR